MRVDEVGRERERVVFGNREVVEWLFGMLMWKGGFL